MVWSLEWIFQNKKSQIYRDIISGMVRPAQCAPAGIPTLPVGVQTVARKGFRSPA